MQVGQGGGGDGRTFPLLPGDAENALGGIPVEIAADAPGIRRALPLPGAAG